MLTRDMTYYVYIEDAIDPELQGRLPVLYLVLTWLVSILHVIFLCFLIN